MLSLNNLCCPDGDRWDEDFELSLLSPSRLRSAVCRKSSDGPFLLPDGLWEPYAPTPARVPASCGVCWQSFLPAPCAWSFVRASWSSCLSREYLRHDRVQVSSLPHGQGSTGRELQQLPYLHTAASAAPASRWIRHQGVGRLIEEQYVGLLKQQTTERHTTAFTTGKMFYRLVFGWTTKRIHRTLQLTVKIPASVASMMSCSSA